MDYMPIIMERHREEYENRKSQGYIQIITGEKSAFAIQDIKLEWKF